MSAPAAPRPVTPAGILAAQLEQLEALARALASGSGGVAGGGAGGAGGELAELVDGLGRARALAAGLEPYLSAATTPESPALRALAERTAAHDWASLRTGLPPVEQEMLSGHVEGQLLKLLVHAVRARRVLDVGMFTGYSALAMAEALPADGRVVACELNPAVAAFAQEAFDASPAGARVRVEVGPAQQTLARLASAGDAFDLVFLDADKAGYLGYLDAVLEGGLLAPGGLVVVDNTLMQGQPYLPGGAAASANGSAITAFNDAVRDDPRVEQVLVPLRDGMTLIRRAPAPEPLEP